MNDQQVTNWGDIIPQNGVRLAIPEIPQPTLSLDSSIEASGLPAGTIFGATLAGVTVGQTNGGGYTKFDSQNNRILVSDGTNFIILMGYDKGAF